MVGGVILWKERSPTFFQALNTSTLQRATPDLNFDIGSGALGYNTRSSCFCRQWIDI